MSVRGFDEHVLTLGVLLFESSSLCHDGLKDLILNIVGVFDVFKLYASKMNCSSIIAISGLRGISGSQSIHRNSDRLIDIYKLKERCIKNFRIIVGGDDVMQILAAYP